MSSYFLSLADFWQFDFMLHALIGTVLTALICGILSPLIIARRYALIGPAISHSTILGISIALVFFSFSNTIPIFLTTLGITSLLVIFLAKSTFRQPLPSDSLIGIFFAATMGLGIMIHHLFANNQGDLLGFLFGNIILISPTDIFILLGLTIITLPIIIVPLTKWVFICCDPEGAEVAGIPLSIYHYSLFVLLTLVIVASIKVAGTVLINTLLLIPGVIGLKLGKNYRQTFLISVFFSLLSSVLAISIANWKGLPPGATLAVVQFLLLAVLSRL